jgi:hypothetical protein
VTGSSQVMIGPVLGAVSDWILKPCDQISKEKRYSNSSKDDRYIYIYVYISIYICTIYIYIIYMKYIYYVCIIYINVIMYIYICIYIYK